MSGSPDISASSVSTAGYEDGLGRRSVRFNREVGGMLECLDLRPQFVVFEQALRARAGILGGLEDERFALVRDFEKAATGLHVISDLVAGQRLIDLLDNRPDEAAVSGIDAAFGFLLQAMPALAQLHAHSITHGAVAPGRIIITPNAQVVLLDNIYGAALERLKPTRQTLWGSFGIMAAPTGAGVTFDRQGDVGQVALCALLLAIGRPLDQSASVASLVPLVREIAELAEIRAGSRFAEGVGRFFIDALPAVGKRRTLEADEATPIIRQLLTHINEDESLSALAELASYRPVPARSRVAAAVKVEPPTPVIRVVAHSPIQIQVPAPPVDVPIAEPAPPAPVEETASLPPAAPPVVPPAAPPVVVPEGSFTQYTPPDPPAEPEEPTPAETEWAAPPPIAAWAPPPAVAVVTPPPAVTQAAPVWTPSPPAWTPPPPPVAWAPPPIVAPLQPSPGVMQPPVAVTAPQVPVQPPLGPRIPVGPPQLSPPVHVSPQLSSTVVKIRQEGPAGYAPVRIRESERTPEAEPTARALSFLDRAAEQGNGFPWKVAASAVLVLLVGGWAGLDYFLGGSTPPPTANAAEPPPPVVAASTTTGGLVIDSQPSGAKVTLDGKEVGVTPLTLEAIKPGRHQVTVTSGSALVQRSIRIEAGKQATLNIPVFSGWVAIFAPIRLEVSSGRRNLGSTEDGRIMLPPGKHVLTLSSAEFGYTGTETVEIVSGEERVLNVQPTGLVNLNASPWAEVWVDGKRAGETPLANLEVPLGTREFVFKHPQYGERKLTAIITKTNAPLSVDFGRPPSKP